MRVIGIDPGVTGAVALFNSDTYSLQIHDFPTVEVKVGKYKRNHIVPALLSEILLELKGSDKKNL